MKPILEFFPIALFFIAYKLSDIYTATGVAIASTLVQVIIYKIVYRKVETMQWVTLALMVILGGATIYLQNEQFIKWKLSVMEWLFGLVFLGSQFVGNKTIVERLMGANLELPKPYWKRLNLSWSLFFLSIGFINLYVMQNYSTDDWVTFKTFVVPGLMLGFIAVQMGFLYKFAPNPGDEK